MNRRWLCLPLACALFLLSGCLSLKKTLDTPPSKENVETTFQTDAEYLKIVCEYCVNSGYNHFFIKDTGFSALADLETVQIEDQNVCAAIRCLREKGYKAFTKIDNTFSAPLWYGKIGDIECGVAYAIPDATQPEVQFMTQCQPLSEDGWFYYVADYHLWRNEKDSTTKPIG